MDRIRIEMDSDISDIYFSVSYYSLRPKILVILGIQRQINKKVK